MKKLIAVGISILLLMTCFTIALAEGTIDFLPGFPYRRFSSLYVTLHGFDSSPIIHLILSL